MSYDTRLSLIFISFRTELIGKEIRRVNTIFIHLQMFLTSCSLDVSRSISEDKTKMHKRKMNKAKTRVTKTLTV